jgi:hypothetical protein
MVGSVIFFYPPADAVGGEEGKQAEVGSEGWVGDIEGLPGEERGVREEGGGVEAAVARAGGRREQRGEASARAGGRGRGIEAVVAMSGGR